MPLTIQEFKHKLTLRVLFGKIAGRNGEFNHRPIYQELCSNAFYAINEILRECELNKEAWAIRRGRRLFIIHAATRRIICEVGVSAEPSTQFFLITLRGEVPDAETMEGLIQATANRGVRRNSIKFIRKEQYEQHH